MATEVEQRIARLEQELKDLSKAFELHERLQQGEFKEITEALRTIEKALATRLPTWATLLITGLGTVVGILLGVIGTHGINGW